MAPPAPPHPAVFLHDAVALSGRFPLLAGVDLEVAVGETVLVEGPNGAGKTSLLRVCAGLVPLASGEAVVLGLDPVRHRNQVRRRVGLLSHASHLYDDLTVRENVRFAVRASGADTDRIGEACERWGLTGRLLKTRASKLSAGQRRTGGLGRADGAVAGAVAAGRTARRAGRLGPGQPRPAGRPRPGPPASP